MSHYGSGHSLFNESPIHGQLGCFLARVLFCVFFHLSGVFRKTKTMLPNPILD